MEGVFRCYFESDSIFVILLLFVLFFYIYFPAFRLRHSEISLLSPTATELTVVAEDHYGNILKKKVLMSELRHAETLTPAPSHIRKLSEGHAGALRVPHGGRKTVQHKRTKSEPIEQNQNQATVNVSKDPSPSDSNTASKRPAKSVFQSKESLHSEASATFHSVTSVNSLTPVHSVTSVHSVNPAARTSDLDSTQSSTPAASKKQSDISAISVHSNITLTEVDSNTSQTKHKDDMQNGAILDSNTAATSSNATKLENAQALKNNSFAGFLSNNQNINSASHDKNSKSTSTQASDLVPKSRDSPLQSRNLTTQSRDMALNSSDSLQGNNNNALVENANYSETDGDTSVQNRSAAEKQDSVQNNVVSDLTQDNVGIRSEIQDKTKASSQFSSVSNGQALLNGEGKMADSKSESNSTELNSSPGADLQSVSLHSAEPTMISNNDMVSEQSTDLGVGLANGESIDVVKKASDLSEGPKVGKSPTEEVSSTSFWFSQSHEGLQNGSALQYSKSSEVLTKLAADRSIIDISELIRRSPSDPTALAHTPFAQESQLLSKESQIIDHHSEENLHDTEDFEENVLNNSAGNKALQAHGPNEYFTQNERHDIAMQETVESNQNHDEMVNSLHVENGNTAL